MFGYGDNTEDEWKMFLKHRGVEGVTFQRPPPKRRIKVDLAGKRFGRLTVLEFDLSNRSPHWICRCDCGALKSIGEHELKKGCVGSCGCLQREWTAKMGKKNFKDLTGMVSGRLTVVERDKRDNFWICRCICGNIVSRHRKVVLEQTTHRCKCGAA
jgi:hypothetical protein